MNSTYFYSSIKNCFKHVFSLQMSIQGTYLAIYEQCYYTLIDRLTNIQKDLLVHMQIGRLQITNRYGRGCFPLTRLVQQPSIIKGSQTFRTRGIRFCLEVHINELRLFQPKSFSYSNYSCSVSNIAAERTIFNVLSYAAVLYQDSNLLPPRRNLFSIVSTFYKQK